MFMKLIVLVFGLLLPLYSVGEPKELVCTLEFGAKDVDGSVFESREQFLREQPSELAEVKASAEEMAKEYGYNSDLAKRYREMVGFISRGMELCKTIPWFSRVSFLFDTNGLKNAVESDVERTQESHCGGRVENTRRIKMKATPSLISFVWTDVESYGSFDYSFNVDRKTLRSGYDTSRQRRCELKDVDTSDNLI